MSTPPIEIPRPLVDRLRRLALVSGQATDDLRPIIIEALRFGALGGGALGGGGPPPLPAGLPPAGSRPA